MYYLQSRYYDPNTGRFLNADEQLVVGDSIIGPNLFAYCNNNPVINVDYWGKDGQTIDLGNGWFCRIDPQNTSTGTKRHIHIWKNDKKYIQNDDGSPHDKGKGESGKIPKWLNKKIYEKTGWNYNENREDFFEETSYTCCDEGERFTFADGTTVTRPINNYVKTRCSVSTYESVYFQSGNTAPSISNTYQPFYLPAFGPASIPSFSFGFSLSPVPLPALF